MKAMWPRTDKETNFLFSQCIPHHPPLLRVTCRWSSHHQQRHLWTLLSLCEPSHLWHPVLLMGEIGELPLLSTSPSHFLLQHKTNGRRMSDAFCIAGSLSGEWCLVCGVCVDGEFLLSLTSYKLSVSLCLSGSTGQQGAYFPCRFSSWGMLGRAVVCVGFVLHPLLCFTECASCYAMNMGSMIGIIVGDIILTILIMISVFCLATHHRQRDWHSHNGEHRVCSCC